MIQKIIYLIFLSIFALTGCQVKENIVDEHSAEYALDYEGVYKGTYPCADCIGIQTTLTLNDDKTFVYEKIYLEKVDGYFLYKGNYDVKGNILTVQENDKPVHFFLGESSITLLDKNLKATQGKLAEYYILKKERPFDFSGQYETFTENKEEYKDTLSIRPQGDHFYVKFSASKVKGREACRFSGTAIHKDNKLWVNISTDKTKEVLMYIKPSHDNLGVEVFTKNFEERFAMMYYCSGGGSLAGKYLKKIITKDKIGVFNNKTTISEVLHTLPNAQIQKKVGHGEFVDDIYDDYEIYNSPSNQHLFTLTPKNTGDIHQKINRVLVKSPFFKTKKGINKNSTYQAIKKAYKISKIEPTREHIVLIVDEINASFSISKKYLKKGWWNNRTKTINTSKIPANAPIDDFILWWN